MQEGNLLRRRQSEREIQEKTFQIRFACGCGFDAGLRDVHVRGASVRDARSSPAGGVVGVP